MIGILVIKGEYHGPYLLKYTIIQSHGQSRLTTMNFKEFPLLWSINAGTRLFMIALMGLLFEGNVSLF